MICIYGHLSSYIHTHDSPRVAYDMVYMYASHMLVAPFVCGLITYLDTWQKYLTNSSCVSSPRTICLRTFEDA
jgi:hypothetical protein